MTFKFQTTRINITEFLYIKVKERPNFAKGKGNFAEVKDNFGLKEQAFFLK